MFQTLRILENRLVESKRKDAEYFSMFTSIIQRWPALVSEEVIKTEIEKYKNLLQRHDRVVVALKGFRRNVAYSVRSLSLDLTDEDNRTLNNIIHDASKYMFSDAELDHFADMFTKSPQMNRFDWSGKTASEIKAGLGDLERIWAEKRAGTIEINDRDKPIIKFPDGFEWVMLERGGCRIEGDAMGHCGNGSGHGSTHIFSLRNRVKIDGQLVWKPSLTFISKNGILGETKGRANTKPSPKYHSYIVELLKSDYVRGIDGGGYKPQNNFHMEDLPAETIRELAEEKPRLLGPAVVKIDEREIEFIYGDYIVTNGVKLFKRYPSLPHLAQEMVVHFQSDERSIVTAYESDDGDALMALALHPKVTRVNGIFEHINTDQAVELVRKKPTLWGSIDDTYFSASKAGIFRSKNAVEVADGIYQINFHGNSLTFGNVVDIGGGFFKAGVAVMIDYDGINKPTIFGKSKADESIVPILTYLAKKGYTPPRRRGSFMNVYSREVQAALSTHPNLWSDGDIDLRPVKESGWAGDRRSSTATYYERQPDGLGEAIVAAWRVYDIVHKVEFTVRDGDDHRNHFKKYAEYLDENKETLVPVLTSSDQQTTEELYAYLDKHNVEYTNPRNSKKATR